MKKKGLIILVAVIAIIGLLAGFVAGSYNKFVDREEALSRAQSEVQNQLQRRADLIPNFVNTVKGYSDYESSTFQAVTEARSKVADADDVEETEEASNELNSAISVWVNAVTEAYPELKADAQYRALQDELAGTESRIATARRDYNKVAESYNKSVRRFPGSIMAAIFDFEKADYFEANEGASSVPQVTF
ncbi:MAG: LemA family protein [Clostridia bacterium]|nr:LemA family protein [Clostridia bacterium]MBQ2315880.1 LemA family protein [Clostridia bacterium]